MKFTKQNKSNKKSVPLTKAEFTELKEMVKPFDTLVDASISIGVGRETLLRTLDLKRCSPETYKRIFKREAAVETAA